MAPMMPLIGGETRMQPVYVGDVANAIADAVDGKARAGATYELGGPEVLSFREIIEAILDITDRKRALLSLPFGLAKLQASLLQFAPGALKLTPDQVELLRHDNVVSEAAKSAGLTLQGLGITPDSLEAVAPQYLWRFRPAGQFQRMNV
jgi:NADH dehydrogenase